MADLDTAAVRHAGPGSRDRRAGRARPQPRARGREAPAPPGGARRAPAGVGSLPRGGPGCDWRRGGSPGADAAPGGDGRARRRLRGVVRVDRRDQQPARWVAFAGGAAEVFGDAGERRGRRLGAARHRRVASTVAIACRAAGRSAAASPTPIVCSRDASSTAGGERARDAAGGRDAGRRARDRRHVAHERSKCHRQPRRGRR